MAEMLREYFGPVYASDVFDYGTGYAVASFVGDGVDVLQAPPGGIDWVITNPPFNLALDLRGLELAREGVALLVAQREAPGDTEACSPNTRRGLWRNSSSASR
jgi:hypothetical protein